MACSRSENAIRFRRSHLAVKMHLQRQDTPLAECVILMGGDQHQAEAMLEEWSKKRACFNAFLDTRKRKAEDYPMAHAQPSPSPRHGQATAREAFKSSNQSDQLDCINTICKCIQEEEGRISTLWNCPDFAPVLVQHYPGFEAYARHVQARVGI